MPPTESKSYDPASAEKRIRAFWEAGKFFEAKPDDRPPEKRFCMVIPPPNVTGALHLGHALNNTLQDILVRQKRMAGFNTLWVVGTDHAGIATQATVEKTIREQEKKSRHELGREELVRRIWEWKEKYGGRIIEQLKLMGCSCDYSRERFTLDEGCAAAVRETFFKMFRDGLIYRGKRLVNWDTQLQTAVADDEVYHEQVKGHFYHFKYPIKEPKPGEPTHVHIATTRPETMLADTAVAVHPDPVGAMRKSLLKLREKLLEASEKEKEGVQAQIDDLRSREESLLPALEKLRDMAMGSAGVSPAKILLPLVDREIPLICDEWADPTLGTGCVKITPAHDANDYAVQQRHPEIGIINMMTPDGRVNENGGKYQGQKLAEARKNVVADLEALGLVEKIEDRVIDLGHSDRSKTPIEPYLSDQWFVKMGDLTEEEASRIQTPELRAVIEKANAHCGSGLQTGQSHIQDRSGDLSPKYPGLAQMAIDTVKGGAVKFHPPRYENTYIDWLSEKRDWCISRQLWWGHRIPIWSKRISLKEGNWSHELLSTGIDSLIEGKWTRNSAGDTYLRVMSCATGSIIGNPKLEFFPVVQNTEGTYEFQICLGSVDEDVEKLASEAGFAQDPDVLDTWFSSALWPHSTLGWTGGAGAGASGSDQSLLNYYYPTNVLSTAREIITLWVARMVITGLYNIGKVPFRDVVIHPVIQDGQGRKMSKSLGNGVDPVDIIEEYGADALRFTLAELATETQDIRLPVKPKKLPDGRTINISEKFEKGRNFCNKLWQASTGFVMRNLEGYDPKPLEPAALRLEDRWILSRMTSAQMELDEALAKFRTAEAAGIVYRFMWDEYCSWYIEMTKSRVVGGGAAAGRHEGTKVDDGGRSAAQQVLVNVLDRLLRMLHPVVPFVTEAIWAELNKVAPRRGLTILFEGEPALITGAWPSADVKLRDAAVEEQMTALQTIIRSVRDIRADVNDYRGKAKQPSMRTLPSVTIKTDAGTCALIEKYRGFITPLAGCDTIEAGAGIAQPKGAMGRVSGAIEVYAPVTSYVDLSEVRKSGEAKVDELRKLLSRETAKLASPDFVNRADPGVVSQAKQRAAELSSQVAALERHLAGLS